MRCVDVVRELAAPTGTTGASDLAAHLAGCPRCSAEGDRAARFDRLWDATSPPEPTPGQWDALWTHVAQALDQPAPEPLMPRRTHWVRPVLRVVRDRRVARVAALALTQAAAVLVAVVLASRPGPHQPLRPLLWEPGPLAITIDEGQDILITAEERAIRLQDLRLDRGTGPESEDFRIDTGFTDPYFVLFNAFEGMDPVVVQAD